MSELLDLEETAQFLRVSWRTVLRWQENGGLHGFKVGRRWMFDRSDLEAYLQRMREQSEQARQSSGK